MRYLLDASALLPLVTKLGRNLIARAVRDWVATTDLAIYEACNSLWKLSSLLGSLSLKEGMETLNVIRELTETDTIHLIGQSDLDLAATLTFTSEQKLTFYDASYVIIAEDHEATLVTQDEDLNKAARSRVEVIDYADLEHRMS